VGDGTTGSGAATLLGPAGPGLPVVEEVGSGPAVVLVHGVGVGPAAFAALADEMAAAGHRAVVVHRPGYGLATGAAPAPVADQVAALVALVDALDAGPDGGQDGPGSATDGVAGVVGVSGGATLTLLLALHLASAGGDVVPVVAHEPLLGPLAPALHHRVRRAVSALGAAGRTARPVATTGFVRRLAGEATWARLPVSERDAVAERCDLVADEARAFAEVAPSAAALARLRPVAGVTTTVGATSGPERRSAATVLASLARVRVESVPDAGHLAHVDAPAAFAAVVLAALGAGPALGTAS
jgi:pimeloyl-ACP methyl ester carboxylesterase